ncbi:MAG: molecular chaperone [Kofleriaceae bacterium]
MSEPSLAGHPLAEALRALAVLAEPPCPEHAAIARALGLPDAPAAGEHTDVLVFQSYPYASVYLGAGGMLGGDARDRIAGFWRAIGVSPPSDPDHVSILLGALAELLDAEAREPHEIGRAKLHRMRCALHAEHIVSWMPPFLAAVQRIGAPFYVAWATALEQLLIEIGSAVEPEQQLPSHLRDAPVPDVSPASLDDLLAQLLAPVRVGFTIVRDDLARCADELGLGLRAGERRFAMRALIGQDAVGVLGWLAAEAGRQAAAMTSALPIAAWWRQRARRSAGWLADLATTAGRTLEVAGTC